LDRAQYETLKGKYGKFASWLIYDDDYGNHQKNHELIENSVEKILNPKYVFCGLNAARKTLRVWEAFHCKYRGGKGKLLRDTFNASPVFKGAYVTDLIKGHVNPNLKEVREKIKRKQINLDKHFLKFRQEMDDLRLNGRYPKVYAFGNDVRDLLSKSYSVELIVHYSAFGLSRKKFRCDIRKKEQEILKKQYK
jgi:hypothetical protein